MKKIILAISLFSLVLSCTKDEAPIIEPEKPIDFYACGGAKLGSPDERAVYWKNGVPTFLSNNPSYANALEVLNGNVHIIGSDNIGSKYWINGVDQQNLSMQNYYLSDICISNNNVYIIGSTYNTIKYWKNGVPFDALTSSNGVQTPVIKVVGADVYIAYKENGVVVIWKNGEVTNLSDGITSDDLKNLEVYNNDVYVLADEFFNGSVRIKYWKNGVPNYLTTTGNAIVSYHIKVNENGIVIGGTYNTKAGYWKNNVFVDLSTPGVNSFNYATNILDNDVFCGIAENGKAKFFKNSTLLFTDNTLLDANFNDCKVIYK